MRTSLCLVVALNGCLVSEQTVQCTDDPRCEPSYVRSAFVLGKLDAVSNAYTRGLNGPVAVTVLGTQLFVSDSSNDRVLVWNGWPTRDYQPADLVIGQKQLDLLERGVMPYSILLPMYMSGDDKRLFVGTNAYASLMPVDANRLVLFGLPLQQNNPAFVASNNVGATPAGAIGSNFLLPSPLLYSGVLFVADQGYSRVLRWNPADRVSSPSPTLVLGQANYTSGAPSVSSSGLSAPLGSPATDGNRLFVADSNNSRVLIWNGIATLSMDNKPADLVLGQANFTTSAINRGGSPSLATLAGPTGIAVAPSGNSTRIVVSDTSNSRVLLWTATTITSGMSANFVLGQRDGSQFGPNVGGRSRATLATPSGVYTDGNRLAVADTANHRVLLWNQWPGANGQDADVILGQETGSLGAANGEHASAKSLGLPSAMTRMGEGLAVADPMFYRVLIWNQRPTKPDDRPTLVLGQSDFEGSAPGGGAGVSTADGLVQPNGVASDGRALAVADGATVAGRILLWNSLPTRSKQPADLVLGKPTFTANTAAGSPTVDIGQVGSLALHQGRLFAVDSAYHRVLIWRSLPTQNNQPADIVLGQPRLEYSTANQGKAVAADTLSAPSGIFVDDEHIYVADTGNHRVLVWNTLDPQNGQAADAVIGQPGFGDALGCMPSRLCNPKTLAVQGERIYIVESKNNRILSWNTRLPRFDELPDRIYGQPDLSTIGPNLGRLALDRLNNPQAIVATDRGVFIADSGNGRIVVLPPTSP